MSDERAGHVAAMAAAALAEGAPPDIVLMRLVLAEADDAVLADGLRRLPLSPERDALLDLAGSTRKNWAGVRQAAAAVPHDQPPAASGAAQVTRLTRSFDAAARISPEASVALYSLGDPSRLERASAEIADWMAGQGLLGADRRLLDIGCGIGRMERALHDRVEKIVGCDISGEMIAVARQRCAALGNVAFERTSGLDLAPFPDGSFDVLLALDSFPYLVAAGEELVERHFAEAGRVLAPGGALLILNYSYRGAPEEDRADFERLCRAQGFAPRLLGEKPFRLWDGAAFLAEKPPARA